MAQASSDARPIVTRFAPSPTGYLHIGGARTALFNWLFARHHGGKFLLRIEDTDRKRHTEAAIDAILDGLSWLGLDWDAPPVSQHAQRERHIEVAHQLLENGNAYRCYLTPDELDAAREKAKADGVRFESPWRDKPASEAPDDAPFAIRFKAPRDGETLIQDAVQGDVRFPNSALDDLIILRSAEDGKTGGPTYNLAVVVDDHDMGVTHVIRGDDHLNNAARQQQIYKALGWEAPVFAHVPLIHGQDGAKLSKRHGALGVEAYRDDGYLADGLANYLLRLGWSHGDDELITRAQAIEWFDLNHVNKAPARLDIDKLNHINAHYVTALSDEEFLAKATPFLASDETPLNTDDFAKLKRAASFLKSRCNTLVDIKGASEFLFLARPMAIEGKAAKPLKKEGAKEMLKEIARILEPEALWLTPEALEERLQALAVEKETGFGSIGAPLRAALTAGRASPSIGEVLYSLGREEALLRLHDQIN
ncbi:MAG: glutamate--tRNA ligase 1 [Hyphococcus sp.]|nr:MAG: glutamate--tRNA ligase 1 [Marinicaulis sp.]